MTKQIKSKKRVEEHGEVFTNEREVKAMCDLVADKCEDIEARFLEPACGDGNFLEEVLRRKMAAIKKKFKGHSRDKQSIIAISSLYGVDIMQDNVEECRKRLFNVWETEYDAMLKKNERFDETKEAARYIISKNILCGNALSMMQVDENQQDIEDMPIIFPYWSRISKDFYGESNMIKRRDFRLDVLIKANESRGKDKPSLDKVPEDIRRYLSINPKTGEFMPEPLETNYKATHYRKVMNNERDTI